MLKRLKWKFIFINMMLVSVVLIIVFGALLVTSYQSSVDRTNAALRMAISNSGIAGLPTLERGNSAPQSAGAAPGNAAPDPAQPAAGQQGSRNTFTSTIPVFTVSLDTKGQTVGEVGGNVEVSDELLSSAVAAALESGATSGKIASLDLRFLLESNHDGYQAAFADASWEASSLLSLVLTSLLIGALALVAFFVVSLFLANVTVKPVSDAWKRQQQFIADASHELKTPLTVILADANILLSHPDQTVQQQEKWVDYIQSEAQRMKDMVQDMLYLARHDAGTPNAAAAPQKLCFSDLVWSALLPFESVAFERGVTLDADILPDLFVMGDESQLRRLVMILLDNACKYTAAPGEVTVKVRTAQDRLTLRVHNTGEPIPPDRLSHVFERFYRADTARTREAGGYGLGLAIAQSIVGSHHGKIWVESTAEAGTTFAFTLPYLSRSLPETAQ